MMVILLAETLITLGAFLQLGCQYQETWAPFSDAITLQSAVVPVVGIGVIKSFSYPCRFGIGASPAAADEVGGDDLGGAGEEGLGESWEVLGGRGGYGSAFVRLC